MEVADAVGAVVDRWVSLGMPLLGPARPGGGPDAERAELVEREHPVREAFQGLLNAVELCVTVTCTIGTFVPRWAPRPASGCRPSSSVEEAGRARPAHPGPGSPRSMNRRPNLTCPAPAPKPHRPGPGRPLGSKNRRSATRYDVGKTIRRPESSTERDQLRR